MFREAINRVIVEDQVSISEIARESQVHRGKLTTYLNGTGDLNAATIEKVFAYLGLEVVRRRKGKGEKAGA